jgi:tRNA1Val (adenine37-N6)-methyltransferase
VENIFKFKEFEIHQEKSTMKVGTDGVLLGSWANIDAAENILDIGTGTGVIAIMFAQRNTKAKIDGVEIDESAYLQAMENMKSTQWEDRLHAFNVSIQDFTYDIDEVYDRIVSNPPFFTGGTFSYDENRNNVRHTVKLPNGDLLSSVRKLLKDGGIFSVILPEIEGLRFIELANNFKLFPIRICEVISRKGKKVERLLIEFTNKVPDEIIKEQLIIYNGSGREDYSEEYKALTSPFYLKM